jgi:hypothetical protein
MKICLPLVKQGGAAVDAFMAIRRNSARPRLTGPKRFPDGAGRGTGATPTVEQLGAEHLHS